MERCDRLLGDLTPAERDAVESMSRRLIAKLLHQPTVALNEAAGSPKGDRLADSLRDLFDL